MTPTTGRSHDCGRWPRSSTPSAIDRWLRRASRRRLWPGAGVAVLSLVAASFLLVASVGATFGTVPMGTRGSGCVRCWRSRPQPGVFDFPWKAGDLETWTGGPARYGSCGDASPLCMWQLVPPKELRSGVDFGGSWPVHPMAPGTVIYSGVIPGDSATALSLTTAATTTTPMATGRPGTPTCERTLSARSVRSPATTCSASRTAQGLPSARCTSMWTCGQGHGLEWRVPGRHSDLLGRGDRQRLDIRCGDAELCRVRDERPVSRSWLTRTTLGPSPPVPSDHTRWVECAPQARRTAGPTALGRRCEAPDLRHL